MEFKDIVKFKREELGLSLQEIADYIGVSVSTVQRYEKGEINNVRRDKIFKLSKILKVTPGYLMGWDELENQLIKELEIINYIENIIKSFGYDIKMVADLGGVSSKSPEEAERIDEEKSEKFDNDSNALLYKITDDNNEIFYVAKNEYERLKNKISYDIKEELKNIKKYGVLNQK